VEEGGELDDARNRRVGEVDFRALLRKSDSSYAISSTDDLLGARESIYG
jgi:hypothetical protein